MSRPWITNRNVTLETHLAKYPPLWNCVQYPVRAPECRWKVRHRPRFCLAPVLLRLNFTASHFHLFPPVPNPQILLSPNETTPAHLDRSALVAGCLSLFGKRRLVLNIPSLNFLSSRSLPRPPGYGQRNHERDVSTTATPRIQPV